MSIILLAFRVRLASSWKVTLQYLKAYLKPFKVLPYFRKVKYAKLSWRRKFRSDLQIIK